jgi:Fe-S-cluster containining protein
MAVEELSKGNWSRCEHLDDGEQSLKSLAGACKIYPERPATCRGFDCLWLNGFIQGDERRRPDKLGLMFAITRIVELRQDVLTAWEVWPGASQEDSGNWFLKRLAEKYKLVVVLAGEPKMALFWPYGPEVRFAFRENGWSARAERTSA